MSYFNNDFIYTNQTLKSLMISTQDIISKISYNLTSSPHVNPNDFTAFSTYHSKVTNHFAVLKNICSDENQMFIETASKSLSEANKLTKSMQKVFTDVDTVIIRVSSLLHLTKNVSSLTAYQSNIKKSLELAQEYAEEISILKHCLPQIDEIANFDSSTLESEKEIIKHYRKVTSEIIDELKSGRLEKNDYNRAMMTHLDKIISCLEIIKEEFALNDTFNDNPSFIPKPDVIEKIVSKVNSHRNVSVIEFSAHNGELLVPFMEANDSKDFNFLPYYVGDVEGSHSALSLGIDNIAKGGLDKIEHNTFDITLCFVDNFFFLAEGKTKIKNPNPSHYYIGSDLDLNLDGNIAFFQRMINSNIPKNDGFIFINIPRFAINYFRPFLLKTFTIVGAYSLNDEFDQVLFVLQYIKSENQFSKLFLEVMTKRNPSIDDLDEILISKHSSLIIPEVFRSNVYEKSDLSAMLDASPESTVSVIQKFLAPEDEIKSLSNPLQEPKPGHLAAIASTRIINGIYHNQDENTVCIFSTKLVRQEGMDISHLPDGTRVEKNIKRNSIVATATFPDGKLITLLNTDSISEDAKAEIEDEEEEDAV